MVQLIMTPGVNGQMTPIIIPSTSDEPAPVPQTYESHFVTAEGVRITAIYHTPDQELANRYEASLMKATQWDEVGPPPSVPAKPESLASKLGTVWLALFVGAIFIGMMAMLAGMVAHATQVFGPWTYDDSMSLVKFTAWMGIRVFPIVGLIYSAVVIFTHSSEKANS